MADEKIKYRQIGGAEMHPDLYHGGNCDEVKPLWNGWMEGDKQGEEGLEDICYPAKPFPPGTKIVISVPKCPKCGTAAENTAVCGGFIGDVACDFDWKNWAEERYS